MKKIFLVALVLACSSLAMASETCSSEMKNRSFQGDLRVSGKCSLSEVTVSGDIKLLPRSSLTLVNSTVQGDVENEGNGFIEVVAINNTISGSIDLEHGERVRLVDNTISGDVDLEHNSVEIAMDNNKVHDSVTVERSHNVRLNGTVISRDLELERNTGRVLLVRNQVSGNLECSKNNPAPTGNQNQVNGVKKQQCSAF